MSAYVNFFIRNEDKFIPLGSYSRNSGMYSIISERSSVPWESIKSVTYDVLVDWRMGAEDIINYTEREINKIKEMFKLANSYSLEDAYEYANIIDEYKENIKEAERIMSMFDFMRNILDEYKYGDDEYNVNEILYVGMEIGAPTVDDII